MPFVSHLAFFLGVLIENHYKMLRNQKGDDVL